MIRALFGGSFDPVHRGHLAMAAHVLERGLAAAVTVVPAAISPHKTACSASGPHRLAMAGLAFASLPAVTVDDRELSRPAPSYTVETLRQLAADFPGDTWRLVMGADNLAGFTRWRHWETVQARAEILVLPRAGMPARVPPTADPERFLLLEDFREPVSSTEIRAMLARGEMPTGLVPAAVEAYIRRHRLYGL